MRPKFVPWKRPKLGLLMAIFLRNIYSIQISMLNKINLSANYIIKQIAKVWDQILDSACSSKSKIGVDTSTRTHSQLPSSN